MTARRECRADKTTPGILTGALAVLAGAVLVQALPTLPSHWLDIALGCVALAGLAVCLRWRLSGWLWCLPVLLAAF
ncbi:MAG: hypothetical protein ACREPS_05775 [Rhodanobacteraceae bacterium]